MTTSRDFALLVVLWLVLLAPPFLWCQASSGVPTDWGWSYAVLKEIPPPGGAPSSEKTPWASSLPQLLVRDWAFLSGHSVSEAEQVQWQKDNKDRRIRELQKLQDQKALDLSRLQLMPDSTETELKTARKAVADQQKALETLLSGSDTLTRLPERLTLKLKSVPGSEGLPAPTTTATALASLTGAWYVVTGTLKVIAGYLTVQLSLTSTLEERVLDTWSGTFAPDEAPEKMHEASQRFPDDLLGGPWSGLDLVSDLPGTEVNLGAEGWKPVPWRGEFLAPGPRELEIRRPGFPTEKIRVELVAGQTLEQALTVPPTMPDLISVSTTPPGADVWSDSRWVGVTPLNLPRPLSTSRLKLGLEGYAPVVVEIGPSAPALVERTLSLPEPAVDLVASRDRFYRSATAFSFSLTASLFAQAFANQQLRLVEAYSTAGNAATYQQALAPFGVLWYGSQAGLALTTGVFVWMMMTLNDYLSDAQTTLP